MCILPRKHYSSISCTCKSCAYYCTRYTASSFYYYMLLERIGRSLTYRTDSGGVSTSHRGSQPCAGRAARQPSVSGELRPSRSVHGLCLAVQQSAAATLRAACLLSCSQSPTHLSAKHQHHNGCTTSTNDHKSYQSINRSIKFYLRHKT